MNSVAKAENIEVRWPLERDQEIEPGRNEQTGTQIVIMKCYKCLIVIF